jgi:hypothetical protein
MVKHRESIIYLIKKLINLRMLTVQCEDDRYSVQLALTTKDNEKLHNENILNKDEFVRWLINHLPSTYSIVRDPESASYIRICL